MATKAVKKEEILHHQVFVYGSLRKGEGNHRVMESAGGVFCMSTRISGEKFNTSWGYPCLMEGLGLVDGEVYAVNDSGLRMLDCLEGHPDLYERRRARTVSGLVVWAYYGNSIQQAIIGEQ
jgi:gamma-glutamylaminecyclotransferase